MTPNGKKPWDAVLPEISTEGGPLGGEVQKHPAFGVVVLTKPSGGSGVFFGTDIRARDCMAIEVKVAEQNRHLNRNWNFGRETLIRFEMTPHQWAEFICSAGSGSGTPCTVRFSEKRGHLPQIEPISDMGAFKREMKSELSDLRAMVAELDKSVKQALDGAGVSKKRQAEIIAPVAAVMAKLSSTLPFVETQFMEAVSKIVSDAKITIAEYAERRGVAAVETPLTIEAPESSGRTLADANSNQAPTP